MKKSHLLILLILLFAASGCAQANQPEQTAVTATHTPASPTLAAELPEQTASATATPEPPATAIGQPELPEAVSDDDRAQIYAAAVRQIYTVDHTFGSDPPEFPFVYIVTTTDDGSLLDAPAREAQEIPAELQQAIEALLSDLPFDVIWIASLDEAPVDPNNGSIADGLGIVITLGNILPQEGGAVHLPVFMVCGGLCALGKTYVLEHVEGGWQVTGSVGPEIMA